MYGGKAFDLIVLSLTTTTGIFIPSPHFLFPVIVIPFPSGLTIEDDYLLINCLKFISISFTC